MKRIFKLFLLISFSFWVVGCVDPKLDDVSIIVESSNLEIALDEIAAINPEVVGIDSPEFTFHSSDDSIFTVTEGIITPVSVGEATLIIGLEGRDNTIDVTINIIKQKPILSDNNLEILCLKKSLVVGETLQLQLSFNDELYTDEIEWTSGNPNIVSIDSDGQVRAHKKGVASIYAIVGSDYAIMKFTVHDNVVDPEVTNIMISGSSIINIGEMAKLIAIPNINSPIEIKWEVDNPDVLSITQDGIIEGIRPGKVNVTAKMVDSEIFSTITIEVIDSTIDPIDPKPDEPPVDDKITLIQLTGKQEMYINDQNQLNLTYEPNIEGVKFKFLSSNNSILEVDDNGLVTAVGVGLATVTVLVEDDEEVFANLVIRVLPIPIAIEISGTNVVGLNKAVILKAQVFPVGVDQGVVWSIDKPSIASIDQNGKVTGITAGKVVISARSFFDEQISATYEVTITDDRSINVSSTTMSIEVGKEATINASISDEPKTTLKYVSSNTNVATVDSNGKIQAKLVGTATITISISDNPNIKKIITINVTGTPTILVSPTSQTIHIGKTTTLIATLKNISNTKVIWATSNAEVAKVSSSGVVTGVKEGTVTISAISEENPNLKAQTTITVTTPPATNILTIEATKGTTINAGDNTNQLYVYDSNGKSISRLECTFKVSNTNILTVSDYGTIFANTAGTVKVTVTHGTKTGIITLTVVGTPAPVTLIVTADPSASMFEGEKDYQLFVKDSTGKNISRLDCKFTSSNTSVVTISQYGTINPLKAGTATVTVTYQSISAKIVITVKGKPKITVSPTSASISVGGTKTITATVSNLTDKTVSWSSSNTAVATVTTTGVVKGIKAGTATITATAKGNTALKATVKITVTNPLPSENKRNTIVETALKEKGYREGTNNNTKYGAWYGLNYQPWCAMFVSWCAYQSGISTSIIPKYASVQFGLDWYKAKGSLRYKTYAQTVSGAYVPKCGDIVFFKSNGASHTGIVIRCVGDIMYTIEGNTSDRVLIRYYYYKNYNKITGYGVPAYPASSTPIKSFSVAGATRGG